MLLFYIYIIFFETTEKKQAPQPSSMTPEDVATLFVEASELFAAIVGQLTDADLHELRKVLFPILLDILYNLAEGKQNLVGIISDDTNYNKDNGISFVRLEKKSAYNDTLAKEMSSD